MRTPLRAHTRRDFIKLTAASGLALPLLGTRRALSGSIASAKLTAVVVGAGIGGLSAAYDLGKAGFDVTVMEKWDFVGGRMRDAVMGGVHFMPHAEGILSTSREIFSLARELGIQLESEREGNSVVVDNGAGPYTVASRFTADVLLGLPGLSDETKSKIPTLLRNLHPIRSKVNFCQLATGADFDDESLLAYLERTLGKRATKQLMDSFLDIVLSAWGWPAESTSKIALLSWMAQGDARSFTPNDGIGVVTRKLASMIDVQLNTSVRYITAADGRGRHTVHFLTPDLKARSVSPDVVVVATEGKYIPELVQGLSPKQSSFFRAIDFTQFVAVTYILSPDGAPKEPLFGGYTRNYPDPIKHRLTAWAVLPAGAEHPDNPPVAHIFPARSEVAAWQASGKSQPDFCLPFLRAVYPALDESKIRDAITRGCEDLIYMPVGYIRSMADVLRDQERGRKGLYFAGEYMAGAHTGAACASGRSVAANIVSHWS